MKRLLTIFCYSLLAGFQCHKGISSDNPFGLPNASENGSDIFACLINGKPFIGKYNPNDGTGATIKGDTLSILLKHLISAMHKSSVSVYLVT